MLATSIFIFSNFNHLTHVDGQTPYLFLQYRLLVLVCLFVKGVEGE